MKKRTEENDECHERTFRTSPSRFAGQCMIEIRFSVFGFRFHPQFHLWIAKRITAIMISHHVRRWTPVRIEIRTAESCICSTTTEERWSTSTAHRSKSSSTKSRRSTSWSPWSATTEERKFIFCCVLVKYCNYWWNMRMLNIPKTGESKFRSFFKCTIMFNISIVKEFIIRVGLFFRWYFSVFQRFFTGILHFNWRNSEIFLYYFFSLRWFANKYSDQCCQVTFDIYNVHRTVLQCKPCWLVKCQVIFKNGRSSKRFEVSRWIFIRKGKKRKLWCGLVIRKYHLRVLSFSP